MVRRGWAGRLYGDSRARGASGACGFWGEHMHVFGTSARVGPHTAGHIHYPLLLVQYLRQNTLT